MNLTRLVTLALLLPLWPATTLADADICFCLQNTDFTVVRKGCFVQQKGPRTEVRCLDQDGEEFVAAVLASSKALKDGEESNLPDLTGWEVIKDGEGVCDSCKPSITSDGSIRGNGDQNDSSSQDNTDESTQ